MLQILEGRWRLPPWWLSWPFPSLPAVVRTEVVAVRRATRRPPRLPRRSPRTTGRGPGGHRRRGQRGPECKVGGNQGRQRHGPRHQRGEARLIGVRHGPGDHDERGGRTSQPLGLVRQRADHRPDEPQLRRWCHTRRQDGKEALLHSEGHGRTLPLHSRDRGRDAREVLAGVHAIPAPPDTTTEVDFTLPTFATTSLKISG